MAIPSSSRPVSTNAQAQAQAHAAAAYRAQQQQGQAPHPHQQQQLSPLTPTDRDLHSGNRNRLWLALKSGIDTEVDWALPLLVLASFDRHDAFIFERWVDPVLALAEWPNRWLDDLEREAAYHRLMKDAAAGTEVAERDALGAIPSWTRSPATELRASYSLQILRNSSFHERNIVSMYKADLGAFLSRFFDLPTEFLVEVATRAPEPFQHILIIFQSLYDRIPAFAAEPSAMRAVSQVLPALAMQTADVGVLLAVLPIMIRAFALPGTPPAPDGFLQHMLYYLTLNPPAPLLDYVLDLLAVLATVPTYARAILSDSSFPAYLKTLVMLLDHGARQENAMWNPSGPFRPMDVPNPASEVTLARDASRRRRAEREADKARMEAFGGNGVFREVADKPPVLPRPLVKELYAMSEPKRSISW